MEQICSSKYWDEDLTWNTNSPIFTSCFLKIALIWGPSIFFWVLTPAEIYIIVSSNKLRLPWTALNITSLLGATIILVVSTFDLIYQMILYSKNDVPPVDYYTPFILFVTMIGAISLMLALRIKGIITSGMLFMFWLFLTLGTCINYYVAIQKIFNMEFGFDPEYENYQFVKITIYFAISFVEFILHCFADSRVKPDCVPQKENPEKRASFISKITFWWFNPMVVLGYKKPITNSDLWELSEENSSEYLRSHFNKYWLPLVNYVKSHHKKLKTSMSRRYSDKAKDDISVGIATTAAEKDISKISIMKPLMKTFGWELIVSGIIKILASITTFVNPLLLDMLIGFVGSDEPYWRGFLYAAGMFFAAMLESFLTGQYEYRIFTIAMKIRSCTISILYEKALTLSSAARKNFTVGEVVNLMAVDTQRMMDYVQRVMYLVTAPIEIGLAIYLLWQQLGIATLGGLVIMILVIPLNGVLSVYMRNYQVYLMKDKDRRTKLMNEILNGIKVLKLYAWENSFIRKVMNVRDAEVVSLRVQAYINGAITFTLSSVPYLVSLASFATFVLIDSNNVLDANRAFVSLSLFNILRMPLAFLPMVITYTAMFVVSLKRINRYLQSDEIDLSMIEHDPAEKDPVVIKDGTFSWTKEEEPTLKDINLSVKEGSLVAIVGQVGAGKSSVLAALLGEMVKLSGRVKVKGSVAYVSQQAWIQNATLQKNILFNKSYESSRYQEVLSACALLPDLEILPGGDQTEIGEKGINLSGGQKQRVSLARSVYNDADIYYFDDPLSTVDVHVGKHIFENVMGPQGLLKEKTRILVTHRISVLPEVDNIIVLQNGNVSETGSYKELLARKGAFADFLVEYLQKTVAEDTDILPPEELNLIQEIAVTVGAPDLARQMSRRTEDSSDLESTVENKRSSSIRKDSGDVLRKRSIIKEQKSRALSDAEKLGEKSKLIEKEAMEVGSVKSSVYLDYMKAYGLWNVFITFVCYALQLIFSLGSSLWLSAWSNDALDPANAKNVQLRNERLGVYGGLGAGEIVFTIIASILLNLACLRASKIIHEGMLNQILKAPMSFFDTTPLGRVLNRFSKDIDAADVTLRFNFRVLMLMSVRALAALIAISLETPFFILACVPLAILYYFLQKFYIPTSRQLKRLESTTRSPIYSHFSETITGASCIRAFKAQKFFVTRSDELVDINNESYYISLGATRWLVIRLEFLGYFIVFMTALFAVLTRNTLSPGIAGLSVSYALQITQILNQLVRGTADVETNLVSVERCLEYTKNPTEAPWKNEQNKPETSWPEDGVIQFDNYSTRYRDGLDLVLKEITCSIQSNERVGIVGRTGAGKSSLTLALFRIIEAAGGKIVIDGVEIQKLGLHDLRSRLTIIPQDPVLFTGSLRMNLDPFENYSDSALWLALEQAHLKDFVQSLEKGLEHAIAEGGENLSVGQRQLVCLARALLRKSKILVLDEATAAVDVETDELIQTTIRSEFADCTILTIAHRLNTIMDYDRVIVLDKGMIKEMDKPENLLKDDKSIFCAMAKDAGLV